MYHKTPSLSLFTKSARKYLSTSLSPNHYYYLSNKSVLLSSFQSSIFKFITFQCAFSLSGSDLLLKCFHLLLSVLFLSNTFLLHNFLEFSLLQNLLCLSFCVAMRRICFNYLTSDLLTLTTAWHWVVLWSLGVFLLVSFNIFGCEHWTDEERSHKFRVWVELIQTWQCLSKGKFLLSINNPFVVKLQKKSGNASVSVGMPRMKDDDEYMLYCSVCKVVSLFLFVSLDLFPFDVSTESGKYISL